MIRDRSGNDEATPLDYEGEMVQGAYTLSGQLVYGKRIYPFAPRPVVYDLNIINDAWITNATTQRDAILELFKASEDAIPFFIETDAHGNKNDGNKGCQNLAEPYMGFITNMQLGDYGSFYSDGENAVDHHWSSFGLVNYIAAIGNHELLANNSASAPIADLSVLVGSFTPYVGILGSTTYGYYKFMDARYKVKYLVFQPHIPCQKSVDSNGFLFKVVSEQYTWAISEMEKDDGYDIVIVNHEPFPGQYITRTTGESFTWNPAGWKIDLTPLLSARKAKQSGTITDYDGVSHQYDFTGCTTDLLCAFYGHMHSEGYAPKTTFGFPAYYGNLFDSRGNCAYGLIDRANRKLYIYSFNKTSIQDELVLDL